MATGSQDAAPVPIPSKLIDAAINNLSPFNTSDFSFDVSEQNRAGEFASGFEVEDSWQNPEDDHDSAYGEGWVRSKQTKPHTGSARRLTLV
jgi:hypothetical protein